VAQYAVCDITAKARWSRASSTRSALHIRRSCCQTRLSWRWLQWLHNWPAVVMMLSWDDIPEPAP